ncbi:MAG: ribosome biogenesis GTP-binding protein YihA/YsxC [Clostridia bacterium]
MSINIHNVEFIRSAVKPSDFPQDGMPQVVFSGKSNVGKSSTINKLLMRKNFARVANSPGKTVHINFFELDKQMYFVDLPGYGYAKVSKAERARWGALIEQYFNINQYMALGILIVDMRHKPTQDDIIMANWFLQSGRPFLVIANKQDKVKKMQREPNLEIIRQKLQLHDGVSMVQFSAEKGDGRDEVLEIISKYVDDFSQRQAILEKIELETAQDEEEIGQE